MRKEKERIKMKMRTERMKEKKLEERERERERERGIKKDEEKIKENDVTCCVNDSILMCLDLT